MTLEGVDVSHWQATTPGLTKLSFLFAKASEGGTPDAAFQMHIANAKRAALVTGAYCFNRADLPLDYQVQTFARVAKGKVDLYALDVEEESIAGRQRFSVAQARYFMQRWRDVTGLPIGLYISRSPYQSGGYADAKPDWLWLAEYGVAQPSVKTDIWQYRGSPLDLDRFEGTRDELLALGVPPAPPSDIEVPPVNQGNVPPVPTLVTVKTGQYLHVDSSMTPNAGNVAAPAGLEVPLLINDDAGAYRIVEYQKKSWWLYWDAVASMRPAPVPVPDCSAAVTAATDPLKQQLALAQSRITKAITQLGGTLA